MCITSYVPVCVSVCSAVLCQGVEDEAERRRQDRACDCQVPRTKSKYRCSWQRPPCPANPIPSISSIQSFHPPHPDARTLTTLLGTLLTAQDVTSLLPPGVFNFLGEGMDKQSQKCAISTTTEGHRGGGSTEEGPLIPLEGIRAGFPVGGSMLLSPETIVLPGMVLLGSQTCRSHYQLCPAMEGASSPPGASSASFAESPPLLPPYPTPSISPPSKALQKRGLSQEEVGRQESSNKNVEKAPGPSL